MHTLLLTSNRLDTSQGLSQLCAEGGGPGGLRGEYDFVNISNTVSNSFQQKEFKKTKSLRYLELGQT